MTTMQDRQLSEISAQRNRAMDEAASFGARATEFFDLLQAEVGKTAALTAELEAEKAKVAELTPKVSTDDNSAADLAGIPRADGADVVLLVAPPVPSPLPEIPNA